MSLINTDTDSLKKIFANWSQKYVERILSHYSSVQLLSPVWGFCDPMECSMPGFPVHLQLLQLAQSNPSSRWCHPTSPPAFNLSQNQDLFQWVSSSHHVAKYWSLIFSISPSRDIQDISFKIDWFDNLSVQEILKSLLWHYSSEASILQH